MPQTMTLIVRLGMGGNMQYILTVLTNVISDTRDTALSASIPFCRKTTHLATPKLPHVA